MRKIFIGNPFRRGVWAFDNMRIRFLFSLVLVLVFVGPMATVFAQDDLPEGPIYVIQPGDTLSAIAFRFGVPQDDLVEVNQLADPNRLTVGDRLIIPGLDGVQGVLTTGVVTFGENLRSLARRYLVPEAQLVRLNRLVSPGEWFTGHTIVLPVQERENPAHGRVSLKYEQSMLELALLEGLDPWSLALRNGVEHFASVPPGEVLVSPQSDQPGPGGFPPEIEQVEVAPSPWVQGETATIRVRTTENLILTGQLSLIDFRSGETINLQIDFHPDVNHEQVALQGIHVMAEPGLYPLHLQGIFEDGSEFRYAQRILVRSGGYILESINVNPAYLDQEVTRSESEKVRELIKNSTPKREWDNRFESPSPFPDYITSTFGNRRSYNGSPFDYYHGGVDFSGGTGTLITAPAPGTVVFAGPLEVRGGYTLIDHGWGVYSGYMHQSEILVREGERVEAGDPIGLVGGTGRVTGAHLHWEIWVGGVLVNPLDWMEQAYP